MADAQERVKSESANIVKLTCAFASNLPNAPREQSGFSRLRSSLAIAGQDLFRLSQSSLLTATPIDMMPMSKIAPWNYPDTDEHLCLAIKAAAQDPSVTAGIAALFRNVDDALNQKRTEISALQVRIEDLTQKLIGRRNALQEQVRTFSGTQQRIGEDLWKIMAVIGGFAILSLGLVRLFSETQQAEWVASGQVTQFVTVMILLSVIMALGISGVLKENSLGTLLGGIGGYVLAQGVGRATARAITTLTARGSSTGTAHAIHPRNT
jgi:hypothetical protein